MCIGQTEITKESPECFTKELIPVSPEREAWPCPVNSLKVVSLNVCDLDIVDKHVRGSSLLSVLAFTAHNLDIHHSIYKPSLLRTQDCTVQRTPVDVIYMVFHM